MFKNAQDLARSRAMRSFRAELKRYANASETWFNGGPDSVDARIGRCASLEHKAQSIIADETVADVYPYLNALRRLKADRQALASLKEDLLTGAASRPDPVRRQASRAWDLSSELSSQDRRWVTLEANRFLAYNNDTAGDLAELSIRAASHAQDATCHRTEGDSKRIVRAFVAKVQSGYRPPQPRRTASAPSVDFDESMIFLG